MPRLEASTATIVTGLLYEMHQPGAPKGFGPHYQKYMCGPREFVLDIGDEIFGLLAVIKSDILSVIQR